MRVPRHTGAYGVNVKTTTHIESQQQIAPTTGSVITYSFPVITGYCYRKTPVNGGRIGQFRLPTPWSMLSFNQEIRGHDYDLPLANGSITKFTGKATTRLHPIFNESRLGSISGGIVFPPVSINTINRAKVEALVKISDQKINLGVALAESKVTLGMISNSILTLYRAYRAARKGRWSEAGKVLGIKGWTDSRNQASKWLEYQYGWMPLISDLYGAQEQLKEGFRKEDQIYSVSRQVKQALNIRDPLLFLPNGNFVRSVTGEYFEFAKAKYFVKVSNSSLSNLEQLGLVNPALIAWELVPLSFVVDWLLPIGNFLSGLTSSLGTSYVAGYVAMGIYLDATATSVRGTVKGTPSVINCQGYSFRRIVEVSLPTSVPYWRSPFNSTRMANAIALLVQMRK